MFATLSVVALVFVTLGRREAAIVGIAVILTLAATLFASWAWGFTLNRVSLFALIFSIGILVDDAIVVVENIHRHRDARTECPARRADPGRGRRGRRPHDPRDVHGDRGPPADGVRDRPHGPLHEPDSDQREHGDDDLARRRVHDHALARVEARSALATPHTRRAVSTAGSATSFKRAADAFRRRRTRRTTAQAPRCRHRRRDPCIGVAGARASLSC